MNNRSFVKAFLVILGAILIADIIFLNLKTLFSVKEKPVVTLSPAPTTFAKAQIVSDSSNSGDCPTACLLAIDEATEEAEKQPTQTIKAIPSALTVREIYIPLGSGSTKSESWVELPGVETVIDSADYPNIKSMILEVSLKIPTANGRVHAKLLNVSDKHDVWGSEVSSEGSTSYRAESANITLSAGRKLYRVMMKSTMGYDAILDWARIKVNF